MFRRSPPPEHDPKDDVLDTVNKTENVVKHLTENDPDEILYWTITTASEIIHGDEKASMCDTYVEPSFSSILDDLTY